MASSALSRPPRPAEPSGGMFRLIGAGVFVILALFLGLARPLAPALPPNGHLALMGLFFALAIWVFKPFNLPLSSGGVIMLGALVAGGIPTATAFSGYTSPAVWVSLAGVWPVRGGVGHRGDGEGVAGSVSLVR